MNVIADEKYENRPTQVDCLLCHGMGWDVSRPKKKPCSDCLGTGLEAVPWTEVFKNSYLGKWKK